MKSRWTSARRSSQPGVPSPPMMKQYGSASSPCTSNIRSTGPVASIAARAWKTSGDVSGDGSPHSRLRLAPDAFVLRWPLTAPSGFMFGTTYTVARRNTFFATGSSRSRRRATRPSIHHDAMDSPGCCRPMIQTTRFAPPSRSQGESFDRIVSTAAASSGEFPANCTSGVHAPGRPKRRQSSGRPSRVRPRTWCDTSGAAAARATRSRCFS